MLRPLYRPVDPASRTSYQPGELAQCDLWFPPVTVPLGAGHHPVLKVPALRRSELRVTSMASHLASARADDGSPRR